MLTLVWFSACALFQITSCWSTYIDEPSTLNDDPYEGLRFTKRYLGALAKNNKVPVQHRSYLVPPMVSPHGNGQKSFADIYDPMSKRYLGALAKSGNLKNGKPQQKRSMSSEDISDPKVNKEDLLNPTMMKQDMIEGVKAFILQHLSNMNKNYDPRKVDLFLENLVNSVYDQNDEISWGSIESLVQSDYFMPEDDKDGKLEILKRSIQSLVRHFNVSYSGRTPSELQLRQRRVPEYFYYYIPNQVEGIKRNLESIMKNKSIKRNVGAMAKNYDFPMRPGGKRDTMDEPIPLEYVGENLDSQFGIDEDGDGFFKHWGKRHTMYDINEPDITFEYPSQGGEQTDYNDYAEQIGQDAPIPIGKRYLGALARSGWLPQGFALRSSSANENGYENKRHIGSLARTGWMRTVQQSPNYYYRGGRGRDFRPPSFRGPKAFFLKSDIESSHCQCKRETPSGSESSRSHPETTSDQNASGSELPAGKSAMLEKRLLLIPAVDYFILRSLYPNLIRRPLTTAGIN